MKAWTFLFPWNRCSHHQETNQHSYFIIRAIPSPALSTSNTSDLTRRLRSTVWCIQITGVKALERLYLRQRRLSGDREVLAACCWFAMLPYPPAKRLLPQTRKNIVFRNIVWCLIQPASSVPNCHKDSKYSSSAHRLPKFQSSPISFRRHLAHLKRRGKTGLRRFFYQTINVFTSA